MAKRNGANGLAEAVNDVQGGLDTSELQDLAAEMDNDVAAASEAKAAAKEKAPRKPRAEKAPKAEKPAKTLNDVIQRQLARPSKWTIFGMANMTAQRISMGQNPNDALEEVVNQIRGIVVTVLQDRTDAQSMEDAVDAWLFANVAGAQSRIFSSREAALNRYAKLREQIGSEVPAE